jgi:hypothetical protein
MCHLQVMLICPHRLAHIRGSARNEIAVANWSITCEHGEAVLAQETALVLGMEDNHRVQCHPVNITHLTPLLTITCRLRPCLMCPTILYILRYLISVHRMQRLPNHPRTIHTDCPCRQSMCRYQLAFQHPSPKSISESMQHWLANNDRSS